jgi:hypothetical protein
VPGLLGQELAGLAAPGVTEHHIRHCSGPFLDGRLALVVHALHRTLARTMTMRVKTLIVIVIINPDRGS